MRRVQCPILDQPNAQTCQSVHLPILWISVPPTLRRRSPSLRLSLPRHSFCPRCPSLPPIHGAFSSIQAIPMTQSWRTLCKTLTITEGSTTTNTITTTTTTTRTSSSITATRLTVQAGKTRRATTSTPTCSRRPRLGRSRTRAPTPVYRRAGVWSSTYRPPSVPPGPRVRGVDLTHTTIMR